MKFPWTHLDLSADKGVISVAISTVVCSHDAKVVEMLPSWDEVQPMPAFGSGVHPREPMSHLYGKECVRNAMMTVSTELQQTLPILVAFASTKMT